MKIHDSDSIVEITQLISSDLKREIAVTEPLDLKSLKKHVESIVQTMLENDFELLIQVLYTIDIDENKVQQEFASGKPHDLGSRLSELIIEREMAKVESREKYRNF